MAFRLSSSPRVSHCTIQIQVYEYNYNNASKYFYLQYKIKPLCVDKIVKRHSRQNEQLLLKIKGEEMQKNSDSQNRFVGIKRKKQSNCILFMSWRISPIDVQHMQCNTTVKFCGNNWFIIPVDVCKAKYGINECLHYAKDNGQCSILYSYSKRVIQTKKFLC